MRNFDAHWLKASVVEKLQQASTRGTFNGSLTGFSGSYFDQCRGFHAASGTLMIFTRDTGHHTSGWFKNPDYERCLHLSLSFREPFRISESRQYDAALAQEWVDLFFDKSKRFIWEESAKEKAAQKIEVRHYRVFCDEFWQPIIPRGEVYGRELTEAGWKSYSELHPDDPRKEPSTLHAG